MRYVIIALSVLFMACTSASQTSETSSPGVPTPAGTVEEIQQQIYDIWLKTTREIVADDPSLACEPSTRWTLTQEVVEQDQDSFLFDLAFLDACKEVGMIPYPGDFSPYYTAAP